MLATLSTGSWGWAGTLGAGSAVTSMATDTSGNVVVSGTFSGTCDVDPGTGVTSLTSSGGTDVFVAKYSPAGTLLWARQFGGAGDDRAYGVAVDRRDDSIVVGGAFSGAVDFDPGAGVQSRASVGSFDAFMSKFGSDGMFQWVGTVGSNKGSVYGNSESLEYIQGIDIDASGTIYATGMFNGAAAVSFGTGTASLSSGGAQNTCILQVGATGNLGWAKQFTSSFLNAGFGIMVMPSGRLAVRGFQHTSKVDFDPGSGTAYGTVYGYADGYVAVLESNGAYVWATTFGTSSEDGTGAITADAEGNLYVVGSFGGGRSYTGGSGTIDVDPGAGVASFTASGSNEDVYVVKLSPTGSYVWGRSVGGTGVDQPRAARITAEGKLLILGTFSGTADFDPGAGQQLRTSAGGYDGFLLTLTPADGSYSDVQSFGGAGDEPPLIGEMSLAVGTAGRSYVSGSTSGVADFSQGAGGVAVGSAAGTSGFLWQFEDLNVAPTSVALLGVSVPENQPSGTVVGTLSTTDLDAGDTFTYSLVSGTGSTDNASFAIVGNQLRTAGSFDYETKNSYSVKIRTTDAGGLFTEKVFVVRVTDVVEDWTIESVAGQNVTDAESRTGSSRLIKQGAGSLILDLPNSHSGGTVVEAGDLIVRHAAALGVGGVTVRGGARLILDVADARVSIASLTIEEGGTVDLGYGGVIVSSGGYTVGTLRTSLAAALAASWQGASGFATRAASSMVGSGLGYMVNADGSVTICFAAVGDTDLDGRVDVLDIANILATGSFNSDSGDGWSSGDFNYDGLVDTLDASDFLAAGLFNAGAYVTATPGLVGTSWTLTPAEAAFASLAAAATDQEIVRSRKGRPLVVTSEVLS